MFDIAGIEYIVFNTFGESKLIYVLTECVRFCFIQGFYMMHELRMYVSPDVRFGLALGRHPEINLLGLHYYVICCEVETKFNSESSK